MQNKSFFGAIIFSLLFLYSCDRTNEIELVEVVNEGITVRSNSENFEDIQIFDGVTAGTVDGTWSMGSPSGTNNNNAVVQVIWDMDVLELGTYQVNTVYVGTFGNDIVGNANQFPKRLRCCKPEGTGFEVTIKEIDNENGRIIGDFKGKGELLYFNENEESNLEIISLEGTFNTILRDSLYPSNVINSEDITESLKLSVSSGTAEVSEVDGGYLISCIGEPAETNQDTVYSVAWRSSALETGDFEVHAFNIGTFDEGGLPSFISSVDLKLNVEQFGAVGEMIIGTVSGIGMKNGITNPPLPPAPTMEPVEIELKFSFLRTK